VAGLDVNEPETIRWAAREAGLDEDWLLSALEGDGPGAEARQALAELDRLACPGVPCFVLEGERFFGKDRVDWLVRACQRRLA
jgi:2-hydroxychromene-2-carboxylate isomerase